MYEQPDENLGLFFAPYYLYGVNNETRKDND